jgi:glycosyltransferase involved in cell wall biosynthesis
VILSPSLDAKYDSMLESITRRPVAKDSSEWIDKMGEFGMVDLYNLADVYVDASSCEGFCLPNVEALACGVPLISVDDGLARTEVLSNFALLIKPTGEDEWVNGADLQLVTARQIAEGIAKVYENKPFASRLSDVGSGISVLNWDNVRYEMVEAVKSCVRI